MVTFMLPRTTHPSSLHRQPPAARYFELFGITAIRVMSGINVIRSSMMFQVIDGEMIQIEPDDDNSDIPF